MSIDVRAENLINRSRADVASFAMNADNDPIWIGGIMEAKMLTDPPLAKGTKVERIATFLGKRIEYVNEVVEYDPKALLVMRSIKGPFPMTISYEFEEAAGGTLARIRVQGEASGFYKLATPVLSRAVKRSITNDLQALKDLLESEADKP
ncbi:MAG: SRPBCC family protein [Dehalococcoidia bacterium]